jgi:FKBP-type peptidyl-prolyl cis-trans isomerase SlyD
MVNKPPTVSDDLVVRLDYTLRLEEGGEVFDTSAGQEPLEFIQGYGQIIPGLEQALYGMAVGDQKKVIVQPEDGYGELDSDAYQLIPLSVFPADIKPEVGMGFEVQNNSGEVLEAFVAELRPDSALLDFNHPLAGETLYFDVQIMGLRPATEEEIQHGHVHS